MALIDERGAGLLAQSEGVPVLGTVGLLELGYRGGEVADLMLAYQTMHAQGAHIDQQILNQSLASFNLTPVFPAFNRRLLHQHPVRSIYVLS